MIINNYEIIYRIIINTSKFQVLYLYTQQYYSLILVGTFKFDLNCINVTNVNNTTNNIREILKFVI